jgi:hypothetical protein
MATPCRLVKKECELGGTSWIDFLGGLSALGRLGPMMTVQRPSTSLMLVFRQS